MTRFILGSAVILNSAGSAFANGDHSGNGWHVIVHMLSEPDHLAMLSIVAAAIVFVVKQARRKA